MAKSPTYRVPFRRRREGKTDYHLRRELVLSRRRRLIVRRSTRYVVAQFIDAEAKGDITRVSAHSKELVSKYNWRGGGSNTSAAYLTGLLVGLKAKQKGITEAVFDMSRYTKSTGSRLFAAVKGVVDAGVSIPLGEGKAPEEGRIRGEHIADYAKKLASDPERYKRQFSQYLALNLKPEDLPQHFEEVKSRILEDLKNVEGKRTKKI